MKRSIFEENLAALEIHSPETARLMRECSMEGLPIELIPTKTQAASARFLPPGTDKPVLLHSAYDPMREAVRWVESIEIAEPTNAVALGAGMGYHLLALHLRHSGNLRYIVVIERDPRLLRLAFSSINLTRIIAHPGTIWIAGEEPKKIPERLQETRTDMILHNCKILPHDPSLKCFADYYAQAREAILDALTYDEINLRTTFESQGRNQFNVYMNVPAVFRGYALKDCEGMLKGYPAIVSAAGPSLDNNIRLLHGIGDRAPLLIVDTAQNTFKKHGLRADMVAAADPTPLNFSHFEKIDSLGDAFLAFHPEVNRQIPSKFLHHPYLLPLFDRDSTFLDFLFDVQNHYGVVTRAMNVGHIAFNLARHLGCAPIVLVGFDYAFPKHGGATHAADAAVSRSVDKMEEDGTVRIGGKEGKAMAESGTMMLVPGYYGDSVPTTVPFQQYIKALEKDIAECDFDVIDATEGGAYFEGSIRMTLSEAMEKTLRKPGVKKIFDDFRQKKRHPDLDRILGRLQDCQDHLVKNRSHCDVMKKQLVEWAALLQQGGFDAQEAKRRWEKFDKVWIEMASDPYIDGCLGTTVQPLYFRRQRATRPKDGTPIAFLQCMYEKYDPIVRDMDALLGNFAHCIDLTRAALQALEKERRI
ncbi:MAG: 6-hydroxymethylpterin diphosphokinase MptE-like protein [Candidatus Omnitrophota bacterium]